MSENLADKQKAGPAKMADEAVVPQVSHLSSSILPGFATPHSNMPLNMSALFENFASVKPAMGYDHSGISLYRRGPSILK
jgi:hypothetical protein